MAHDRDDEEEERRRLEAERARLTASDRLYGPKRKNADGFIDGRAERRTGRVFKMLLRLHPRVRAILAAIRLRDGHPSYVVLFEDMLEAYQQVHGAIPLSEIPTDDDLIARYLEERDKRDGE